MSKLTDWGENLLADFWRGQGVSALASDWTVHILTAVSESSHTKATWTGYAGQTVARSLAAWAGTQGAGTTLASTGTSHQTSNNGLIDFGTVPAGGGGTMVAVGLFSGSNLFAWVDVDDRALAQDDQVSFAAGSLVFTLGLTGGCSDYLANKLIDLVWRAQSYTMPANTYSAYTTTAPTNAAAGTEPGVGGYARVAIPSTLSGWGPTQGDLSTNASSGTGGRIGNRAAIIFPSPTADQGTIGWGELFDASSGGNLLIWRALAASKSVLSGGPAPRFPIDDFGITFA